jgi:hypothetical protein
MENIEIFMYVLLLLECFAEKYVKRAEESGVLLLQFLSTSGLSAPKMQKELTSFLSSLPTERE